MLSVYHTKYYLLNRTNLERTLGFPVDFSMEFFLNEVELSLNSVNLVNSGNLINY